MNWKFWKKNTPREPETIEEDDCEKIEEFFRERKWASNWGYSHATFISQDGVSVRRFCFDGKYEYVITGKGYWGDKSLTFISKKSLSPDIDDDVQKEYDETTVIRAATVFAKRHIDYKRAKEIGIELKYPELPYKPGDAYFELFVDTMRKITTGDNK